MTSELLAELQALRILYPTMNDIVFDIDELLATVNTGIPSPSVIKFKQYRTQINQDVTGFYRATVAAKTIEEIKALNFGYLTGEDLVNYCPFQTLQLQDLVSPTFLDIQINTAYEEIKSYLRPRYLIENELEKTGNDRNKLCVKLTTIQAIKNIIHNLTGISEKQKEQFEENVNTLRAIQNGQLSLNIESDESDTASTTEVLSSSFLTIG